MNESEIIALIKRILRKEIAQILMGTITSTNDSQRGSMQRFATEGQIGGLRMIQPYGFACRPPAGTPALISPVASDPTHLNIVGQFDLNRPTLNDGEAIIYNEFGQMIYMENGKIRIGSKTSNHNFFLGDLANTFLGSLIDLIVAHTHAAPGAPPTNVSDFNNLKSNNISNNSLLSTEVFGQ